MRPGGRVGPGPARLLAGVPNDVSPTVLARKQSRVELHERTNLSRNVFPVGINDD
jgi:hypothetical protein